MRRFKLTAGPGCAASYARVLGLLLVSSALLSPVQAMQVTPPDAATKAAMDRRTAARALLSSALARLAANASDSSALLDAGRASIDLDDYRAALGFLARAEQADPRSGAVKAALGSAMVHMENPTRALDYFGEAQLLGAPERIMLADRGLARDLLGQQDAAQRDYQMALSIASNDETLRRYALSLGISGETDRAVTMLTPQLRAQDRGAWRLRAMILAMNGREQEATEIVNATMPPALAQNILPYLTQMDRLNPAQQAAAAHFGRFPNGQLGPKRKPVQIAAATPVPVPAPTPAPTRRTNSERPRGAGAVLPAPVRNPASGTVPAQARPVVTTIVPPTAAPTPTPTPVPTPRPTAANPFPAFDGTPGQGQATVNANPVPARPTAANPFPAPDGRPGPTAPEPPAAAASEPPTLQSPFRSTIRSLPDRPVSDVAPATPEASVESPETLGPGFSIATIGQRTTAATPAVADPAPAALEPAPAAAAATSPAPPPSAAAAAPLASLADIVGSIEIPAEELAQSDNAIGADTLAKLQADKRRADAAEAAKREKDEAAVKAKAEADTKAKAEATEKKANPARIWVQVATGANAKALATDFGKFAKKSPAIFKGKSAATAEWGKTRRLLVGPFKDRKTAQDWLADYKKAGGDGFLFNSEAGESVDPIK